MENKEQNDRYLLFEMLPVDVELKILVGNLRVGNVRVGNVRVGNIRVGNVRVGIVSVGDIRVEGVQLPFIAKLIK